MGGPVRALPYARRPGAALGPVFVPGSKSVAARVLLLAALAPGLSECRGLPDGEDTRHLVQALHQLGFPVHQGPEGCRILGGARPRAARTLELGASGLALRLLLPWLALEAREPVTLTGAARLFERPLGPLLRILEGWGARWETRPGWGRLHPVPAAPDRLEAELDASLSSQFLSGLALAAAARPGGGRLRWTPPAASASYLDLSALWMARFGCESVRAEDGWEIPGGRLRPGLQQVPGDWSGAAAFLCGAAVLGSPLRIGPLDAADPQGDRRLLEILGAAGSTWTWEGETLCFAGALRRGLDADLSDCPDLGPVLMATAALAPGPSRLSGLGTLRLKECDRLEAGIELVAWLGGEAEEPNPGCLAIRPGSGPGPRPPFDPRQDHRMAFAAAVGGLRRGGGLQDPDCVAKTFPGFWTAWDAMLAGRA